MKGLNLLILLGLILSLMPWGVEGSYDYDSKGIEIDQIQANEGYFTPYTYQTGSEWNAFGSWGDTVVSIQDIKYNIERITDNEATVVGDKVIISTGSGEIIASPHTLEGSGWVQVDFKTKNYSGDLEILFGFNGIDQVQMVRGQTFESYAHTLYRQVETEKTGIYTPQKIISQKDNGKAYGLNSKKVQLTVLEYGEEKTLELEYESFDGTSFTYKYKDIENVPYVQTYTDWKTLDKNVKKDFRQLKGANVWDSLSTNVQKDVWYTARFWVDIPFAGTERVEGKYNIAIKPVNVDLSQAVVLDPWYGTGWLYRKELTCYGSPTAAQVNYQKKYTVYKGTGTDIPERIAEYTTGDTGTSSTYGSIWYGQTFTAEASANVTKARWKILKFGLPTSSYAAAIRATAAGVPTGANLCSANITSTYVSSTASWYEFDFGVGTALTSGTQYAIILYGSSANATDLLRIQTEVDGTIYTGGTRVNSADGGATWASTANRELMFQIITTPKIYCGGNCQDDFDDIRFTRSDQETLLDHWIESYTSGVSADVWVELDNIVQMTTVDQHTHYYMYYGNSGATAPDTSHNMGVATFPKFEDFEWGADEDDLSTSGGSVVWTVTAVAPATVKLDDIAPTGFLGQRSGRWFRSIGDISGYFIMGTESDVGISPYKYMFRIRKATEPTFTTRTGNGIILIQWRAEADEDIVLYNGVGFIDTGYNLTVDTWELWERKNTNYTANTTDIYQNGVLIGNTMSINGASATYADRYAFAATGTDGYLWVDNCIVSSYVAPEPLWGTAGTAVTGIPLVTTLASTGSGNNWIQMNGIATSPYAAPFTSYGFDYGETTAYGSNISTTTAMAGAFSSTVSSLTPASTYHYRAWAINTSGIGYGLDMTATTAGATVLYENYLYGCNTTWSQTYETDSASIYGNWTSGTVTYTGVPVFGNNWTAQTFTTTSAHSVSQIVLWMNRTTTAAAGYVYVSIRDGTSDNVTSPDLGIGLYAIGYVPVNGGPIEVSLENEIQLDYNKKYAIVVRAPSADATNYVSVWGSSTSIYTGGNAIRSITGGASWVTQTYDIFFSIIGKPQPIYGNVMAGQSFTVGAVAHTAVKTRLILGRVGQPGNVYVSIRSYSGGTMSNADLTVVALNGNAITLDKAVYDCVLTPEKSLEANKQYAIVVSAPSGDRYNYVMWCADSSGGYTGGNATISINAGISWTSLTYDYNFEIWGNPCISVLNAKVFKNYLATDDWLICAEVMNVYPPYYDNNEDPSMLYQLSFMSQTGTVYAATPCELWEKNPITIYMNPTQATALTWGGNYKVRVGDLSNTYYSEYGLQSTDWNAASLRPLDNWVRLTAKDMEVYQTSKTGQTVSYLTYASDKGYVLNENGGAIFNQACPRLSYVRPDLFLVTSNQPDIPTTVVATPGANISYRERLGTYLADLIDSGAGAMGIGDPKTAGGLMIIAIYALFAFGTVMKGYAWAGMIAAFPVILLGMYYGLLDVQLILAVLVILILLFVREFIWKGG